MASKRKWFKNPGDIKVGVIGYGGAFNMGKKHLAEMKRAGMRPFAVCDMSEERLEVARQDFKGIETCTIRWRPNACAPASTWSPRSPS